MRRWLFAPLMIPLLALTHCVPYPPPGYYAVPAQAVRGFQVYFAFGSVGLTAQDQSVLADAAAYANSRPGTPIRIYGHADAPGAPEGNAAISRRRSEVVAEALARLGVKQERMSLAAYGETMPVVVTNPGGMQPENRRVDILIQ
jgi:outer membrane protein OmpA-like peptidoglycan-associated protein